jgi:hypothetical protein
MPGGPPSGIQKNSSKAETINPASPMPVPAPTLEIAPAAPAITPVRPGEDRPF